MRDMDSPEEDRDYFGRCRFCGFPGSYLITEVENGKATTYALCRDHASEKGAHSQGILPLVYCPQCERKMSIGWGKRMFAYCSYCRLTQPYSPPGIR